MKSEKGRVFPAQRFSFFKLDLKLVFVALFFMLFVCLKMLQHTCILKILFSIAMTI